MNQQSAKKTFTGTEMLLSLLRKLKLIICITLAVTIVTAAVSGVFIFSDISYGGSVSFYLTKADKSYKLLPSLTSQTFAERLLLDEYGLPAEYATDPQYKDAYNEAKQAVIAFNEVREEIKEVSKNYYRVSVSLTTPKDPYTGETISSLAEIQAKYEELQQDYIGLYDLVSIYKAVNSEEIVTEEHKIQVQFLEKELEKARIARDAYKKSAYEPAMLEKIEWDARYSTISNKLTDTRENAETLVSDLLEDWRKNYAIKEKVSKIASSLSFSYDIPGDDSSIIDKETVTTPNKEEDKEYSFLKVYVSVAGDEELAAFIIQRLKEILPEYTEKNIEKFGGGYAPQCVLMSPFSQVSELDMTEAVTSTVLAAVIAFVLTAAVVCLAILGKEWSKRMKAEEEAASQKNNNEIKRFCGLKEKLLRD